MLNALTSRPPIITSYFAAADGALKFVALLGLMPAIATSLIAPRIWMQQFALCLGDCAPERLMEPVLAGVPVYSAIAALAFGLGLALALACRSRWALLWLAPLLLFVLRGWIDVGADRVLVPDLDEGRYFVGEWLYNVSTSIVFLAFVFSSRRVIRTPYFAAFVALLVLAMIFEPYLGAGELLFFLASFAVARIGFRFLKENWALFARIGLGRTSGLLAKSLVLMTPILVLIFVAEVVIRQNIESAVANYVYANRPLCAYREWLAAAETPYGTASEVASAYVQATDCPSLAVAGHPADRSDDPGDRVRAELEEEALLKLPALHAQFMQDNRCPAAELPAREAPRDLERDLCYYAEYLHAGRAEAMKKALLEHEDGTRKTAAEIRGGAHGAVRRALPSVRIYRKRRCTAFPWLPCEIKQSVLWVTDRAVNGAIGRARASVLHGVNDVVQEGVAIDAAVTRELDARVDDASERMRLATRAALSNGFDLAGVFDHVLLVLLVLAFLKSLLFIFARVVFSSVDPDAVIAFTDHGETLPHGAVKVHGQRYTLTGKGRVFYARQAQVEGIAPGIALPRPLACVVSRLLSGVYLMNRADTARAPEGRIVFKTGDVRQFVEWQLAEGEQVIFHFKDFIAADESVAFSTLASFRIPTLLMGRFLYRVATGPGRLILRTDGAAETVEQGDSTLSKPVHRVVAWHRAARFKLEAEQSFADIYLSDVHVKMTPGDMVIFVAEAGDKRRVGTGAARFLKTFILPV